MNEDYIIEIPNKKVEISLKKEENTVEEYARALNKVISIIKEGNNNEQKTEKEIREKTES